MLKMRSRLHITRNYLPVVMEHPNFWIAKSYHRFDGYAHAGFQHQTFTVFTIVEHWWVLVHLPANAMACQFPDNAISFGLTISLYRLTDIP